MRRLLLGAIAALALLAVTAGVTLAAADEGDREDPTARTLRLDAAAEGFVPVVHDGEEPTSGDVFVERFALSSAGEVVGAVDDECVLTPDDSTALCSFVLTLDGGSLAGTALVTFGPDGQGGFLPRPFDVIVTGGTGDHLGASGSAEVSFEDHTKATWVMELR